MSTTSGGGFSNIDAFTAVSESFSAGWQRMSWLLFTGPNVSLVNWLTWGLILFVAAPGGGGGGNSGSQFNDKIERGDFDRFVSQIEPWMIAAAIAVVVLVVLFSIVWLYFQSRFRLLMLHGVQSGVPRIRGVFGKTGPDGLRYFLLEIGLIVAFLVLAIPAIVAWFPFVMNALRGNVSGSEVVIPLVFTFFWLIPVGIALAVVRWWIYDLALPYVVFGGLPFGEAMGRAWALTKARFGAVTLHLITRFLVAAVAYCCVMPIAVLCTCLIWGPPVVLAIPFVAITVAAPLAAIVTVPIVFALGFVMIWLITTITAPIPLFFRSWSVAFVSQLDPEVPLWAAMSAPSRTPAPPSITPPETS